VDRRHQTRRTRRTLSLLRTPSADCKACGCQLGADEIAGGGFCKDCKALAAKIAGNGHDKPAPAPKTITKTVEKIPAELQAIMDEQGIDLAGLRAMIESKAPMRHCQFPLLLSVMRSGSNAYLAGPAGSGKTTAAENCADTLGIPFYMTGAIASEFKLLGFVDATGTYPRDRVPESLSGRRVVPVR